MNTHTLFKLSTGSIALSLFLLFSPQTIFAKNSANPYSSTKTIVLEDGISLDIVIANSPPTPPVSIMTSMEFAITPLGFDENDVVIPGVPAYDWSYGASATAGAMIAGYYDNAGYPNMYTGPENGGVMPLTNVDWDQDGDPSNGSHECPLSATKNGLDGRAIPGHVDDYFSSHGAIGPDPYVVNGWTEHTIGDCTGDYMKSSKWFPGTSSQPEFLADINQDGGAAFVLSSDGERVTASYLEETRDLYLYDAGYGLKKFFESRDYTVSSMYNQYIPGGNVNGTNTVGFTYDQYKVEINAGRPVMLNLTGHIVVGTGYNDTDPEDNVVIYHDSWWTGEQTLIWGDEYHQPFPLTAVTIVRLATVSEPSTAWLPAVHFLLFSSANSGAE